MCYKKFDEKGELNCGVCIHYIYEQNLEDNTEECSLGHDRNCLEDCKSWWPQRTPEEEAEEKTHLEKLHMKQVRMIKRIERVRGWVKPLMGDRFSSLEEDFKDCHIWSMGITKVPPNKMYKEDADLRLYIEQHGCEDYGYHGRIWYHLRGKHWVVMEFNC